MENTDKEDKDEKAGTASWWKKYAGDKPGSRGGIVKRTCFRCGKIFERPRWWIKRAEGRNKDGVVFCSLNCHLTDRNKSPEQRAVISQKQKGVACPSRGRSRPQSEETKKKLREMFRGVSRPQDYNIVLEEMKYRGVSRYANLTRRPIPDAVFVEDGKLTAVEVEKKQSLNDVRYKMESYHGINGYDRVILVWYSPQGERLKEWTREDNGEWTLTP